jgi:Mn2+/Fe2+ NRAMP family transporter
MIFGLLRVQPIPAIILAQALNGILLPVVAVFLILAVNDRNLIPAKYVNSTFSNILMLIIVGVTCFLGFNNIWKALGRLFPAVLEWPTAFPLMLGLSGAVVLLLALRIFRN